MVARVVRGARIAPHGSDDRCPGALHAVAADDGALVRVRVPGGYLAVAALAALADVADRYGAGSFDITARANVQLRRLREGDLDAVAATLRAAQLLPASAHERVRNVVANPYAGIDATETRDVRPFVAAFDRALCADANLAALPPKFLFAFDGGGYGVDADGADLVARASGSRFTIAIAGDERRIDVAADDVVTALLALGTHALDGARTSGVARSGWRMRTLPSDVDRVPASLARHVVHPRDANGLPGALDSKRSRAMPTLGMIDARDPAFVALVPSVPLGRLSVAQARALVRLARAYGGDLRLAPWRGIVIGGIARRDLACARADLAAAHLPVDASDGFAGIAACAGRGACDAALADVRADAVRYAATVARAPRDPARLPRRVNFAGCAKRCAMRRGAAADLVATASGYDLWIGDTRMQTSLAASDAFAALGADDAFAALAKGDAVAASGADRA